MTKLALQRVQRNSLPTGINGKTVAKIVRVESHRFFNCASCRRTSGAVMYPPASMVREGSPDTDWRDFLAALENPPENPQTRPQELAVQMIASMEAKG